MLGVSSRLPKCSASEVCGMTVLSLLSSFILFFAFLTDYLMSMWNNRRNSIQSYFSGSTTLGLISLNHKLLPSPINSSLLFFHKYVSFFPWSSPHSHLKLICPLNEVWGGWNGRNWWEKSSLFSSVCVFFFFWTGQEPIISWPFLEGSRGRRDQKWWFFTLMEAVCKRKRLWQKNSLMPSQVAYEWLKTQAHSAFCFLISVYSEWHKTGVVAYTL